MSLDFDESDETIVPLGDPDTEKFTPWQDFKVMQKAKKYLYMSTGTILLLSILSVIFLGISVSKMHNPIEIGLSCGAIALNLIIFGSGIVQVGIYKEKDLIISM